MFSASTLTKNFSKHILTRFLLAVAFIYVYCEYLIYFVTQIQCDWPALKYEPDSRPIKVMVLADTHLLGERNGHWLDKLRREWQMERAFQTAMLLHNPEIVFILGDIFDEGKWSSDYEFEEYIIRFNRIFAVPPSTKLYVVAGNHDIGFHYRVTPHLAERFSRTMASPPVQLLSVRGNIFVLINSIAMEGDGCSLCDKAVKELEKIENILRCAMGSSICNGTKNLIKYSPPIVFQHFPLYRATDAPCTESDAAPIPERYELFEERINCLSKESTEFLIDKLRPRAVFGAHTHHSCRIRHSFAPTNAHKTEFIEYTVPSFSWRYRTDPKYYLVTISSAEVVVSKCGLPREWTIHVTAIFMLLGLIVYLRYCRPRAAARVFHKKWSGKKV